MAQPEHNQVRTGLLGLALLGLAGCATMPPGQSARYHHRAQPAFQVVLPAGAPSIGQQFRRLPPELAKALEVKDHLGLDVQAPLGTPVLAAAPGRVSRVYTGAAYGRQIDITHDDGDGKTAVTRYFHLDSQEVQPGQRVARGERIGTLGHTGLLAGQLDHLHFSILYKGRLEDPNRFWLRGPGQITCFGKGVTVPNGTFGLTYPVPCG